MSEVATCGGCKSMITPEDVFCPACGSRAPGHPEGGPRAGAALEVLEFSCQGCGATMTFDARQGALSCPFCDSVEVAETGRTTALAPEQVAPFEISEARAHEVLRSWMSRRFWAPGDLAARASIENLRAVHVPCWAFEARTHSFWAADSSHTPPGSQADWCPVSGEHRGSYRDVLVVASGVLRPGEIDGLVPFRLAGPGPSGTPAAPAAVVEAFGFGRKYARGLALAKLEGLVRAGCAAQIPGRSRNLHVNVRVEAMTSTPVLVPVWVVAYAYADRPYRMLVNGQTGRATGAAPFSWFKVSVAVALAVSALLLFASWIGAP